ncbi:hypothetical protein [uncultured Marivita sp.]|uniref:hypothetical protein n=1 Tax=uncultured Marivita sp. TaxID=888080 RepID=UPI002617DA75|nr:hypothetical protein [uncultured Marivita sp.]
MLRKIKFFWQNDSGAVTVDWVVLTAAVVGLAMAAWASAYDASVTGVAGSTGDAVNAFSSTVFPD